MGIFTKKSNFTNLFSKKYGETKRAFTDLRHMNSKANIDKENDRTKMEKVESNYRLHLAFSTAPRSLS